MIEAYHEIDILYPAPYDGSYRSIRANFREAGCRTFPELLAVVALMNGWGLVENQYARPYDFAVAKQEGRYITCFSDGFQFWSVQMKGVAVISTDDIVCVYRVGGA